MGALRALPRGQKTKPLVSKFGSYDHWVLPCQASELPESCVLSLYPKGSRVTHRRVVKWGQVRVCSGVNSACDTRVLQGHCQNQGLVHACLDVTAAGKSSRRECQELCLCSAAIVGHGCATCAGFAAALCVSVSQSCTPARSVSGVCMKASQQWRTETPVEKVIVANPREPADFVAEAAKAGHPRDLESFLDAEVKETLRLNFLEAPHVVAEQRASFFRRSSRIVRRRRSIEAVDAGLH